MMSHTPITKPCSAEAGISVIYFTNHNKRISTMMSPLTIVRSEIRSTQNSRTNNKIIPDNAHAIQNTLCLLDAVTAANQHHRIPVSNPTNGSSPLASAREILKGILIVATLRPAFRFLDRSLGRVYRFIMVKYIKKYQCGTSKGGMRYRLLSYLDAGVAFLIYLARDNNYFF